MTETNLKPFLRPNLDVLFVALNPAEQSNANGHYFSGIASRFFQVLHLSGLITTQVPKATGDEIVFGSTLVNFGRCEFGVVDLVEDVVQTNSAKVRPTRRHVEVLLLRIREFKPRFVCTVHWRVRDALSAHGGLKWPLTYGTCGAILPESAANFVLNYFPNGNSVKDELKLKIFRELRVAL